MGFPSSSTAHLLSAYRTIIKCALNSFSTTQTYLKVKAMPAPIIYKSLESVLEILQNETWKEHQGVSKLLATYEDLNKQVEDKGLEKKFPLIVLEGLDGSGKTTVSRKLAKHLGAVLYHTPPDICYDLRPLFENDKFLRTAYYALGNYIGSLEMALILQKQPIILDRYWHSTAAYALASAAITHPEDFQLPVKGAEIYKWPTDLLKPDAVFLLTVSEDVRIKRISRRSETTNQENLISNNEEFRKSILQAYANMENPSIVLVDGDPTIKEVLHSLKEKVKELCDIR